MMFDDFADEDFMDDVEAGDSAAPASTLLPPRENTELYGHDDIEKSLLALYNEGKLPHALIFTGPMGVGKTTMAFRLARFLFKHGNGDDNQDSLFGDAPPAPKSMAVDSEDPVFRRVVSGGHPDLRVVERPTDAKTGKQKGNIDVDTARTIAPFLRMSASEGGWRVIIIDEADTMNYQAQNAILKILEEPPAKSLIVLICNRLGTMLPTIRSRCRTFHFAPLNTQALNTLLKQGAPQATTAEIAFLTALADGSMGRAKELIEEEGAKMLETILGYLEDWPDWNWAKLHPWADNITRAEKSYESFTALLEWTAGEILRAKAAPSRPMPAILKTKAIETLQNNYSLEQWIDICEKLKAHFIMIDNGNLDKRQGVLGAFAILGGQVA